LGEIDSFEGQEVKMIGLKYKINIIQNKYSKNKNIKGKK
jgi:hypothetical protein